MHELDVFIRDRLHAYPGARCKFLTLNQLFIASLTRQQQQAWPRHRVLAELRKFVPVAPDATRVLTVGGLSFDPPPAFAVEGGRLVLQTA